MKIRTMVTLLLTAWMSHDLNAQTLPSLDRQEQLASNRKKSKVRASSSGVQGERRAESLAYWNFLPFGAGQFMQNKKITGTVLAATQAGALMLYFDRLQQVRTANDDAAAVINGVDPAAADASVFEFLNNNEKFVRQAQRESQLFLFGFIGLYTLGVVDAVFDPLETLRFKPSQKKNPSKKRSRNSHADDLELTEASAPDQTVGFLVWPESKGTTYLLSLQSRF
jgi:hypothetical protein